MLCCWVGNSVLNVVPVLTVTLSVNFTIRAYNNLHINICYSIDEHDNSKDQADASSFVSKALTLRSSSVKTDRLLIMLLIISSVAVVISFTLCLVCCTKCCRRRINRFRKDKYDADRYLDVEGDYLINGMYI